jgi:GDPmannose 4,6-dehydratase
MFGHAVESPQDELTRFRPVSPYAVSKVAAHFLAQTYREAYGIFVASGILYNHESYLRPNSFVTRKITNAVARIRAGKQEFLRLGTLDVSRDWGYAGDYVEAMWLMLQQDDPDDYIVATGKSRPLADFVSTAFQCAGMDHWSDLIVVDPSLSRPTEVARLVGDPSKANMKLGWAPRTSFEEMIEGMVHHDLELVMQ